MSRRVDQQNTENFYAPGTLAQEKVSVLQSGLTQWVDTAGLPVADLAGRCDVGVLQQALSHLDGLTVVSATLNDSGAFEPPQPHWDPPQMPVPPVIDGLPPFCDILLHQQSPGGHVAHVRVWVPLAWNGRLLGTGGMGSITGPLWFDMPTVRTVTMPMALRNGFATFGTDAGNRDPRFFEWPLDRETGKLDIDAVRNWSHRSIHDATVIAKAVVEALHGRPARFSYFAGCSGGGRQGLSAVQNYPDDFDGVWSADPAINWSYFWGAVMWPGLVMKERGNALPPAKLEAFTAVATEQMDGADGLRDGIIGIVEMKPFDTRTAIGRQTAAGPITAEDAETMRLILDGPRRANGERLGFALPIGTVSWGPVGMWRTAEVDGKVVPVTGDSVSHLRWITEDLSFDWTDMDFARFEELMDAGARKFAEFAVNDPVLEGFRAHDGKLLISQAVNDQIIMWPNTVDYVRRVAEAVGGVEIARRNVRLFSTDGDNHGTIMGAGPGLTAAGAMAALMNWVEDGVAPEMIVAERVDPASGQVVAKRPAYAYPDATRYKGEGDPRSADSYTCAQGAIAAIDWDALHPGPVASDR